MFDYFRQIVLNGGGAGLTYRGINMRSPRIIVVEDEPAIRRGVCDALRLSGYVVGEAADGVRGLAGPRRRTRTPISFCSI